MNATLRRVPVLLVYLVGVIPAGWLLWRGLIGDLGADPVKTMERNLGEIALQLIVAGLAITPLQRFTGVSLIRFRRAVGVLAFGYVAAHLSVWLVLDMALLWAQILEDLWRRPYITVGMLGFVLLLPLAVTSNDWSVRRLGGLAWRKLHRLVYPAAVAGAVHYLWLVKAWPLEPLLYLGTVLALLMLRVKRRRLLSLWTQAPDSPVEKS